MNQNGPTWIETVAKAVLTNIPVLGPTAEVIVGDIRARRTARADAFLARISRTQNERDFLARLSSDPRLERIFVQAVESAIDSAVEAKRRVLANAIADASINPTRIDAAELLVEALANLEMQHVRALAMLSDEWDGAKADTSEEVTWGTSDVWKALPKPLRAALVRSGVGSASSGTLVAQRAPARSEGITDFGLEVVGQLRAEGWNGEAAARGWVE